jgi:glycosyltransferase involved in cell wall biosynthesis
VKGKVNQAMAFGLPVVATTTAIEGMNLRDGKNVLVGDSPSAFAKAIVQLYKDEDLWNILADGGKSNVSQIFSKQVARDTLSHLLNPV